MRYCGSLFGITLAQTVFYYRSFPNDTKINKSLVSVLYVFHGRAIIAHRQHGTGFHPLVGHSYIVRRHVVRMLNSIRSASVLDTVHVYLVCDSFWDILLHARPLQKPTFTMLSWYVRCSPSLDWNQFFAGCRQLTVRVDFVGAAVIDIGNFADIVYYCRESYMQGHLL